MSKFSEMRGTIEPVAVVAVKSIPITGSPSDLRSLLWAAHVSQVKAGQDQILTMANALSCQLAVKKWLEAFEAECDRAEAEAGAGLH